MTPQNKKKTGAACFRPSTSSSVCLSESFILLLSPYFYQYIERGARQLMGDEGSYLHK